LDEVNYKLGSQIIASACREHFERLAWAFSFSSRYQAHNTYDSQANIEHIELLDGLNGYSQ